jgi:hypothetical protein
MTEDSVPLFVTREEIRTLEHLVEPSIRRQVAYIRTLSNPLTKQRAERELDTRRRLLNMLRDLRGQS